MFDSPIIPIGNENPVSYFFALPAPTNSPAFFFRVLLSLALSLVHIFSYESTNTVLDFKILCKR